MSQWTQKAVVTWDRSLSVCRLRWAGCINKNASEFRESITQQCHSIIWATFWMISEIRFGNTHGIPESWHPFLIWSRKVEFLIPTLSLNTRLLAYSFTSSNDSSNLVLEWSNRLFNKRSSSHWVYDKAVVTGGGSPDDALVIWGTYLLIEGCHSGLRKLWWLGTGV